MKNVLNRLYSALCIEGKNKCMRSKITKDEEKAYRFCHHEFQGQSVAAAAILMSVSESKVRSLLKSLKRKAPQLFPILTKRQCAIWKLYVEHGCTQRAIAIALNTTQQYVEKTLQRIRDKGIAGLDVSGMGDTVSYSQDMDKFIKRKF